MRSVLKVAAYTMGGGAILGFIGFAAGFFGPMIFEPEANQGPLMGIFVTGPLGVVVGIAAGFVVGCISVVRSRNR